MRRYPLTNDQRQTLDRDLSTVMETLRAISSVLRGCYDDDDLRVWRADEACGAVQRLLWALERQTQTAARGSVA